MKVGVQSNEEISRRHEDQGSNGTIKPDEQQNYTSNGEMH